jgi:citrate-Mg2+:H+ or citrate-Ca2+:H+ symporter, CitMHS family
MQVQRERRRHGKLWRLILFPTPRLPPVLTLLGFAMIVAFMALIMTKRMSVLAALVLVPIPFALLAGFRGEIGPMMLQGIVALAPTAVMLLFAILFFSIMMDVGLFDPIIRAIVWVVREDPLKIVVGTAVLTLLVSLDGDGSTTYLIVISALLPLYKRLGLSRLVLASVIMLGGGVMNILPWGGPTARAASALKIDPSEIFIPMIPAIAAGAVWVIIVAFIFGIRERRRLGAIDIEAFDEDEPVRITEMDRPGKTARGSVAPLWLNLLLTIALMVALTRGFLPLPVLFMVAFAVALLINFPSIEEQKARMAAHAGNALAVASVVCAAGVLMGIMSGTKMIDAMGHTVVSMVPAPLGPYLAIITGVLSIPFTFFLSNDAFYFGMLPILAQAASTYGISAAEIGRASVIGQPVHLLSPLVPSTYLLVGLAEVELGDHQKFTLKWSAMAALVLFVIGLATAVIPWRGC